MTTCSKLFELAKPFKEKNDYEGFLAWWNNLCGTSPNHAREFWNAVGIYTSLQICSHDMNKVPVDALRPLMSKQNETLLDDVLPKVRSYIKDKKSPKLTRRKVEEFLDRTKGILKTPTPPKHITCANCGVAPAPIEKEGLWFCCERCSDKANEINKRLANLSTPQKTEKKTYKETPEYRKAQMHPKESKMDWDIFLLAQANQEIKNAGYRVVFQKEYVLLITRSDVTLEKMDGSHEKVVYLDHTKIHKKRRDRDAYLRGLLEKRYPHAKVIPIDYENNTEKTKVAIMKTVVGAVKESQQ